MAVGGWRGRREGGRGGRRGREGGEGGEGRGREGREEREGGREIDLHLFVEREGENTKQTER